MLKLVVLVSGLASTTVAAEAEFKCENASAFYYSSMFSSQLLAEIADNCSKNLSPKACGIFMQSAVTRREYLEIASAGDIAAFLFFLKYRCPDHFPEDPTKFPDMQ
ncbi:MULTISPECIES: hypothetical protein [Salipiger]|uniref:hypothetical protein n=1 Tax=Salipiger TaxID=263377 RepID=UPI0035134940